MEFDHYTIALLDPAPGRAGARRRGSRRIAGRCIWRISLISTRPVYLLVAGPLDDEKLRGLSILNVEPDRARELKEQDPAVRRGRFSVKVIPWMVPSGAMSFSQARIPRSSAEAES